MGTSSDNKPLKVIKNSEIPIQHCFPVNNAGVVLLNHYIPMLFGRLNLTTDQKQFTTIENQLNAVQYLQYLVTGLNQTAENLLPLNKVLCGVSLSNSVPDTLDIPEEHKKIIDGLIIAAIGHWPAIGTCTIGGFRGNWFVRDGLLIESEDKWELRIEKRAYDLLLYKSPFTFTNIKYPWMNKPLLVSWLF